MSWSLWRKAVVTMADLTAIVDNLKVVQDKVAAASKLRTPDLIRAFPETPRLVAVSKTKPKECLITAYQAGQRHFGENYVQELVEKAENQELSELCPELKFHFIGHLQKNKISKLLSAMDKLFVVETIDSQALAQSVNDSWSKKGATGKLNVMVQVNTSGEHSKSGVKPTECKDLVSHILKNCNALNFIGLMTIGAYDRDPNDEIPSPDFQKLAELRTEVCKECDLDISQVELSMGMSADYEEAIRMGSTNVRVGSTIFGSRLKPE